jgi:hypothetical protein
MSNIQVFMGLYPDGGVEILRYRSVWSIEVSYLIGESFIISSSGASSISIKMPGFVAFFEGS